ncbi:hypothetical protein SOVF_181080 [Spinacia oleracea]|nr:hypothetical protein SOVF_181080 [Spinacia oleracea]
MTKESCAELDGAAECGGIGEVSMTEESCRELDRAAAEGEDSIKDVRWFSSTNPKRRRLFEVQDTQSRQRLLATAGNFR